MRWYDLFSHTYDRQLEALYRPYRPAAVAALHLAPGDAVLDLACGTGQNFDLVAPALGPAGHLYGLDASAGMLRQARRRVERAGWTNVTLVEGDAARLDAPALPATFDAVLCTLGLSAMPAWETAFARSFARLRPGGRYVILDAHAERRTLQTRLVELLARADLARRVWAPLADACPDATRLVLDAPARTFGGALFVAAGTKPEA